MLTTTHVALNGALSRWSTDAGAPPRWLARLLPDRAARRALVVGGLAPDVALGVLAAGAYAWFPLVRGWDLDTTSTHVWSTLFFTDPVWVAAHNSLHAPLVLAALGLSGHAARRRPWGPVLRALAVGCALHTVLDVPTHVDDGPLLLFPLDRSTRFHSPVSYYDPDHFGNLVAPVDLALTVGLGGWLVTTWWRRRRADVSGRAAAGG